MDGPWQLEPRLDRMGWARRDPARLASLWQEPAARLLVVDARGAVAVPPAQRPGDLLGVSTGELAEPFDPQRHVLLGGVHGDDGLQPWFCRRGEVPQGRTLREADLDGVALELVTAATAVLAWHDAAPFCERCGAPSRMAAGGFARACTGCGSELFPRTDPAMIVAVLDEHDRLLLAHQAGWPEGRVSVLAGFVEAGESAEHAVVREVAEECGLQVSAATFLGSQPWPFPRSLMLGHVARARGQLHVDGVEIAWARWYSPQDLELALEEGLTLPGRASIAGRMIEAWRRGVLPRPEGPPGPDEHRVLTSAGS